MTKNILVCYATRYGSTKEAAAAIGDTLSAMGHRVTVADLQEKMKKLLVRSEMIITWANGSLRPGSSSSTE